MKTTTKRYLIALPILTIIDAIWLIGVANTFYTNQIGFLLAPEPNLLAAVAFYLLFIFGLIVFVVSPALEEKSLKKAVLLGALFGLITYATYDLTNLATIKDWPILVTVVDLVWGAVLASSVATLTFMVARKFEQ